MSGDHTTPGATPWQTVGPFFHVGLAMVTGGDALDATARARIRLRIRVTDGDGQPVTDAVLEIWQAEARPLAAARDGTDDTRTRPTFGRLPTDEHGACEFETVRQPAPADASAGAAHINVCLLARGLLRPLYTRLYFRDDPMLEADAVLALVPAARRQTLIAQPDAHDPAHWLFDVRLQGDGETVFFDL